jgi:hypothetical protein
MGLPKKKMPVVVVPKPRNMQMVVTKASLHVPGNTVLNQDFKEFVQSLNDHQVRYLVIGGYAVASPRNRVSAAPVPALGPGLETRFLYP